MATTQDIKASTLEIKGRRRRKRKMAPLPKQYKAPPGSAREKTMRKAARLYKSGKKQQAFKIRNRQEAAERRRLRGKSKK